MLIIVKEQFVCFKLSALHWRKKTHGIIFTASFFSESRLEYKSIIKSQNLPDIESTADVTVYVVTGDWFLCQKIGRATPDPFIPSTLIL